MSFDEDEVRRRLAAAVSGLPFDPPDAAPLQAEGRRRRRNRRIGSAAGVVLSVAVVAGVVAVGPGQSASPTPAPVLHQPNRLPSAPVRPAITPSSAPPSAVATSTVDPTAPVRVAYANATGVWIATLDPVTAHELGKPVLVSDAFTKDTVASSLQFSPQGRYLVWTQHLGTSDDATGFGLYDGETGNHVTVRPQAADEEVPATATGTGAAVFFGKTGLAIDSRGTETEIPGMEVDGAILDVDGGAATGVEAGIVGTFPGGFLVSERAQLVRIPVGGTATEVAPVGPVIGAGDSTGTEVFGNDEAQGCVGIQQWTVVRPDGTASTVVFTKHPGRNTLSLTVSPDGVVGGIVQDCDAGGGTTSFVELDGVIAHTTATDVDAAARGPHDIVGEVRGNNGNGDHHLRIYNAANQLTTDLGGPVSTLVFAPEHRP